MWRNVPLGIFVITLPTCQNIKKENDQYAFNQQSKNLNDKLLSSFSNKCDDIF